MGKLKFACIMRE